MYPITKGNPLPGIDQTSGNTTPAGGEFINIQGKHHNKHRRSHTRPHRRCRYPYTPHLPQPISSSPLPHPQSPTPFPPPPPSPNPSATPYPLPPPLRRISAVNKVWPFIIVGVIGLVISCIVLFKLVKNNLKTKHRKSEERKDQENGIYSIHEHGILRELYGNFSHENHRNAAISLELIQQWTDNFSDNNVLGHGGFGMVYKGELQDGTTIAVKRMVGATIGTNGIGSFESEIAVLSTVRHRHLVALFGYCLNGNEKILIYEYMPKGTLAQHLFQWRELGLLPLTWEQRVSIAIDVARGVEYLHSLAHQSLCFIHRDLKPSNLLLGNDMKAKVADFGLVKRAPEGKHSFATRVAGTFGYLAPEYAATGKVTRKVDVYAFGAILMEMITGRKALDETQLDEGWMCMHLVTWFRGLMLNNQEQILESVDEALSLEEESISSIFKVAELAVHCTDPKPYNRPDMGHAVKILGPIVEEWKPPIQNEDEIPDINIFWKIILDE